MNFVFENNGLNLVSTTIQSCAVDDGQSKYGSSHFTTGEISPSTSTIGIVPISGEISPSLVSSGVINSVLLSPHVKPIEFVNNEDNGKFGSDLFKIPSKHLVTKGKPKYRLIRKSPLKSSPIKSLNHILRKHKLKKTKGLSPRKLKFILPKVTKFSPRKRIYGRLSKSEPLLIPKEIPISSTTSIPTQSKPVGSVRDGSSLCSTESSLRQHDDSLVVNSAEPVEYSSCCDAPTVDKEQLISRSEYDIDEEVEDDDETDQQQQEERLAAFLKASSTIASQKSSGGERRGTSGQGEQKLTKQQRKVQERIRSLSYQSDLKGQQEVLALHYLLQVKEALSGNDNDRFDSFVSILNGIWKDGSSIEDVYYKVMELLKEFPKLQDGFVMFLRPDQAVRVGRFHEYVAIRRMREFADELKHQFSRQPQNLQKFIKTLQTLIGQETATVEQLTTTLTPLLKLQPWLLDTLTQCLPSSTPLQSLPEDFEEINLDCPIAQDGFEHVNMVEEEVRTTVENCACDCHLTAASGSSSASTTQLPLSAPQSSKSEHCLSCGLRFLDGRVYLQCGKTLRLAKVTYPSKGSEGEGLQFLPPSRERGKKEIRPADKGTSRGLKGSSKTLEGTEEELKPKRLRKKRKASVKGADLRIKLFNTKKKLDL